MLVAAAFAGAAACGGNVVVDGIGGQTGSGNPTGSQGSGGVVAVSCDINTAVHVCAEIDNPDQGTASTFQSSCMASGGTPGTGCSSANRLGTCAMSANGISETGSFYSGPGVTVAAAQMACASAGGTWTSG
jgi:hypothetical protein